MSMAFHPLQVAGSRACGARIMFADVDNPPILLRFARNETYEEVIQRAARAMLGGNRFEPGFFRAGTSFNCIVKGEPRRL